MLVELIIALALVAICAGGWVSAERALDECERELEVALGWAERDTPQAGVVLHAIDGGGETS